jgi:hypothetical protein
MGMPKASAGRSSPPQSSHATANAEAIRAPQAGQRARSSPPQPGQAAGTSGSLSAK